MRGGTNIATNKIAPSYKGSFNIYIDPQDTDVAIKYSIKIDASKIISDNIRIVLVEETGTYNELVKTDIDTYTGVIPLGEIKEGCFNNVRVEVVWDDIEYNNVEDVETSKDNTINLPVTVNVVQYLGEEIKGYTVENMPKSTVTFPYLPDSTYKIEDGTDLNNGLTIIDTKGNEFVWIEVPKSEIVYESATTKITDFTDQEYTLIEKDLKAYTSTYRTRSNYSDTYYSVETTDLTKMEYDTLKKKMLKSIYTNGGFWIGKYETGDATATQGKIGRTGNSGYSNQAVIKKNQVPYNYVSCRHSQILAETFNPDNTEYSASLMFGVQWDLVLKYLQEKGVKIVELKGGTGTGATNWGNYINSDFYVKKIGTLYSTNTNALTWFESTSKYQKTIGSKVFLATGSTPRNSKMNIYDLAGNVCEWTLEYSGSPSSPATNRGGYCGDNGTNNAPIVSWPNTTSNIMSNNGFRVTIY